MKSKQEWAYPNQQLLQATIRINESHAKWIEVWKLTIVRLVDELSVNGYTSRMLQASRSVIQVMKSLLLFRITMMANWSMVQERIDNNSLLESTQSAGQLEEAYSELTVSVLRLYLRLLEDINIREEQGERITVYRQISGCLDIITQWRMLTELDKGVPPGAASSKLLTSEAKHQELLRAIHNHTEQEQNIDIGLLHRINRSIQDLHSLAAISPSGKPGPEIKEGRKEQAPGKVWLMKGIKLLSKF